MRNNKFFKWIFISFLILTFNFYAIAENKNVEIVVSQTASSIEMKVAHLLKERLQEKDISSVKITWENSFLDNPKVRIILGIPKNHQILNQIFYYQRIKEFSELSPGTE